MPLVNRELTRPLAQLLIPVADDSWMMGQHALHWVGHAPTPDDDLFEATRSQTYLRHAYALYAFIAELDAPSFGLTIYSRPAGRWRHAGLFAQSCRTWPEWLIRTYCFESFDTIRRRALHHIAYAPLTALWETIDQERRTYASEAARRISQEARRGANQHDALQNALEQDWTDLAELSEWGAPDEAWATWDIWLLKPSVMRQQFAELMTTHFTASGFAIPGELPPANRHARHHDAVDNGEATLADMTRTAR
ncbi:MAG: phenylacetate-CoA oxygenase subunit PaaI [Firmicutes bacterium]|nr:phenylacetate-CoA oxygenase subunit PaaI [Bacillota bacterium]